MGNAFAFTAVSDDESWAQQCINGAVDEVTRIEALLTTFTDDSETARINAAAGAHPVVVSAETFALIERSLRISRLTQGAFDVSYGAIDRRFWNFDTGMKTLPDREAAKAAVRRINYRNVELNTAECSVFLKAKGMRIGFGGIGKGYAADRAAAVMKAAGVKSGVVNAAGDLVTWGMQPDGSPWTIGIADPSNRKPHFSSLKVSGLAVATSGDYEKYVVINGRRYSHTIDPKTGFPVSGIKSATIICPSAELADALATPVMVMGVKAGLGMINQMNDIACIIVDDAEQIFTSKNIRLT